MLAEYEGEDEEEDDVLHVDEITKIYGDNMVVRKDFRLLISFTFFIFLKTMIFFFFFSMK